MHATVASFPGYPEREREREIHYIFSREREREIHYIFSSHLRADQMCRGSFLGIHQ